MPLQKIFFLIFGSFIFAVMFIGCEDQKTYRDSVNSQNDSFTQSKQAELKTAESTYQGIIHLNENDQEFNCILEIKQTSEFTRVSQSQDQTETVEMPKLAGSMRFPVLENIQMSDLSSYYSLTTPMGGYLKVMFDFGNYNPRTQKLILPYTVPAYTQSTLGELNGTLIKGHYQGTWFSKPFGVVGTFDLTQSNLSGKNGI